LRLIYPDLESPEAKTAIDLLVPSMANAYPFNDTHMAIQYIKTLTKGFSVYHVLDVIYNNLFPHVEDLPRARASFLGQCVRQILRVIIGTDSPTSRDDTRNQRLLTSGFLIQMLFQGVYDSWIKATSRAVDEAYNYNKELYKGENFLNIFSAGNVRTIFKAGFITEGLNRGFKGKWSIGGAKVGEEKTGVLQALSRLSYLDFMSHCRRVVLDFDTGMKLAGPRRLHPSQYGYFCTSETPSGGSIGITKNLSMFVSISTGTDTEPLIQWLFKKGKLLSCEDTTPTLQATMVPVFLNNGILGYTATPKALTQVLKLFKRTACLPPYSSMGFDIPQRRVFIYMDEGRPLRPLWRIPFEKQKISNDWRMNCIGTLPQRLNTALTSTRFYDPLESEPNASFDDYTRLLSPHQGCIEYLDPYEQNEALIANLPEHIVPETTHMEIHPSTILGLLGNMIPFPNHNQSPRNQLSASQSKQGLSMYATNWKNRFDNTANVLCYGEAPLVRTMYQDYVGSGKMAYGQNIVLAMGIYSGYNQEDGIVMNADALARGLFRSITYRSYEAFEEDDPISKAKTRIGSPTNVHAWMDLNASLDYSKLDDSGIVRVGEYVTETTVIVGRYMQTEGGKFKDASVTPQVWTRGRVESVVITVNNEGLRLVKIRVVQDRTPELGDKFCLTEDHDVLTTDGWIPIKDITTAHSVAQLSSQQHTLEYVNPLETFEFDHTGEMVEIKTSAGSLLVTTEHRLFVSKSANIASGTLIVARGVFNRFHDDKEPFYMFDNNKKPYLIESVQKHSKNLIGDKVYCISVPSEVFLVRRQGNLAESFWTGNSNRHGQKGTLGMAFRAHDLPRTEDGIVPDMIMNPHAIPSRMTIGQLLEQLFGKAAAELGGIANCTAWMNEGSPHEQIGAILEQLGLEKTGNQILYNGQTGEQIEADIFIGNTYSMRLKHMTEDKWNARGDGRREQRTHQPTGGRGNQGGLKIGEMERDAIVGHGVTSFVHESMMRRSDGSQFYICNGCGTIPIYNEKQRFFICPTCDGPIQFIGDAASTLEPVPPPVRSATTFSKVNMPYATKLFYQELEFFMNIGIRTLTSKDPTQLHGLRDLEGQILTDTEGLELPLPTRTYQDLSVPEILEAPAETVSVEDALQTLQEVSRQAEELARQVPIPVVTAQQPTQEEVGPEGILEEVQLEEMPEGPLGIERRPIAGTEAPSAEIFGGYEEDNAPLIVVDTTPQAMIAEGLGKESVRPVGRPRSYSGGAPAPKRRVSFEQETHDDQEGDAPPVTYAKKILVEKLE
jgi:DNA-directed RNA polymerase II subunit RPB2